VCPLARANPFPASTRRRNAVEGGPVPEPLVIDIRTWLRTIGGEKRDPTQTPVPHSRRPDLALPQHRPAGATVRAFFEMTDAANGKADPWPSSSTRPPADDLRPWPACEGKQRPVVLISGDSALVSPRRPTRPAGHESTARIVRLAKAFSDPASARRPSGHSCSGPARVMTRPAPFLPRALGAAALHEP